MTKKSRQRLDKPFRANLRAVWREFKRCSEMYLPLYHERLLCMGEDNKGMLTMDGWEKFIAAHPEPDAPDADWWIWDRMSPDMGIGRFWGCPDGLFEFMMLAESAAIIFDEMELPIASRCFRGWLHFIHELSWGQQLPLLLSSFNLWDGVEKSITTNIDEHVSEWHCTPDGTGDYPLHPSRQLLKHSVFTASMTLIEAVLDPESVMITSDALDEDFPDFILVPVKDTPDEEATVISPELHFNFPRNKNVFKKISEKVWVVQFVEGGIEPEQGIVNEQVGFYHIQKLLSSEKQPVSYVDLYAAIPVRGIELLAPQESRSVTREDEYFVESQGRHSRGGTGSNEMATKEVIASMRQKRKELLAEIERANSLDDDVKEKLQTELFKVQKYLNSVSNLWGYPRQFELGTPESKACNCVKKNISVAMASLKQFEKLSAFLKNSLQPQGAHGRQYTKAGEVKWEIA